MMPLSPLRSWGTWGTRVERALCSATSGPHRAHLVDTDRVVAKYSSTHISTSGRVDSVHHAGIAPLLLNRNLRLLLDRATSVRASGRTAGACPLR